MPTPSLDQSLRLRNRGKPMDVQAFVAKRPVEGFDESIVLWFAWSREVDACAVVISPEIDQVTGELGAVVGTGMNRAGSAGGRVL